MFSTQRRTLKGFDCIWIAAHFTLVLAAGRQTTEEIHLRSQLLFLLGLRLRSFSLFRLGCHFGLGVQKSGAAVVTSAGGLLNSGRKWLITVSVPSTLSANILRNL